MSKLDDYLAAVKARADGATPGPYRVWDGPKYCGGGADLCIATACESENWLANMGHRFNHYRGAQSHGNHPVAPDEICDICSFGDAITAEQRATADFIAAARTDVPKLLRMLRDLIRYANGCTAPEATPESECRSLYPENNERWCERCAAFDALERIVSEP